jgi:hypothetical protein
VNPNPTEIIREVGPRLFGARWQSEISVALRVSTRSVRRWTAGDDNPRPVVWEELIELMRRRAEELDRLIPRAKELASGKGEGNE